MRWLGVSLGLMACEPQALEAPLPETVEAVVEHCGDFVEEVEEEHGVNELVADEVRPDLQGPAVMVVEPIDPAGVNPERVPLERGDLDTSPLPRCHPWPACLEALVRDKPLSERAHLGVWLFDGEQVTPAPGTRALTAPLDGAVIADLPRGLLYELATRKVTRVTTDGPRLHVCTGDDETVASECQALDLFQGVVELRTGLR
ncbi:MAG: hypothetical protein JNJ54_21865 [Myxococcaceae bacterium]|nr:hypothetical protein [Myxococcaceae bacterium]